MLDFSCAREYTIVKVENNQNIQDLYIIYCDDVTRLMKYGGMKTQTSDSLDLIKRLNQDHECVMNDLLFKLRVNFDVS